MDSGEFFLSKNQKNLLFDKTKLSISFTLCVTSMIKKNFSNKREVWRVKLAVARVRKVARTLLTLDEKDPRRLFEGINLNQFFNSSY